MSTPKPPGGKAPVKPFLGDDDLSELDAWVETFDALHMEPSDAPASGAPGLAQPDPTDLVNLSARHTTSLGELDDQDVRPGEWQGEQAIEGEAALEGEAAFDGGHAFEGETAFEGGHEAGPVDAAGSGDFSDFAQDGPIDVGELPDAHDEPPQDPGATTNFAALGIDPSTLDAPLDEPAPIAAPPAPRQQTATAIDIEAETDFSGLEEPPAPPPRPVVSRTTTPSMVPPAPPRTTTAPLIHRSMPVMPRLHLNDDLDDAFAEDDGDVFTSALRPGAPLPEGAYPDDDLAPPPAPEPRRGPAIVRRAPVPPLVPEDDIQPGDSDSMFSEQTRVADFTELEQRVFSSRQSQPTVQPPPEDDDDYADIEVSDDKSAAPEAPTPEIHSTSRRTAHVLRRSDSGARVPPGPPPSRRSAPEPVQAPAPRQPSNPGAEDDFSDVAAAVGAEDDFGELRRPRPTRPGSIPEIDDAPQPPSLDDALDGLHPFDDSNAFADSNEIDAPDDFGPAPRTGSRPGVASLPPSFADPSVPDSQTAPTLGDAQLFGAEPAPFDDPDAFEDHPAEPSEFDEPQPFSDDRAFEDSNDFDAPNDFSPASARPAPPAPPQPPVILPPGVRLPRTTPYDGPGSDETTRGVLITPLGGGLRPPALNDLYPRVKTPTSVPPIGRAAQTTPSGPLPAITPLTTPLFGPGSSAAPVAPPTTAPMNTVAPPRAQVPPGDAAADELPVPHKRSTRLATPLPVADEVPGIEPVLDVDAIARDWPEQVAPLPTATLDEASAQALLVYERELMTVDDSLASAALRIEAGRLCERLTDFERARGHYDAALMADPRATPALRGLRRLARTSGDLQEAIRHLDAEIEVAGALERRPLGHYRVDLMMASNEQDLARVAAGELLDQAPSDVRALLAQLELAFLDGRADEFGVALEQLAQAVSDTELRAALQSARGALAAHHNDTGAASRWFQLAAESDPTALAALLGAIRQATGAAEAEPAARALIDLARQVEQSDPITAAAAAVRAQQWVDGELAQAAALIAATAAPADPLVARLAAGHLDGAGDPISSANAFIHWAHHAGSNAERAYAAARAAELDPARGTELWASALALDPGDDYAAAQLRTSHVAAESTQAAIDVDLAIAADHARDRARLRAAYGMIAQGQLDGAIDVLQQGRAERPGSIALSEALGEALAAAGKWTERAKLFAELAEDPGEQLDREVAQLRSALAWEEAVGAVSAIEDSDKSSVMVTTASALDAWERVLERGSSPSAHAAAIVLATRLGDNGLVADALIRAQAAERQPLAAASLALRRARLAGLDDPQRQETILRDLAQELEDRAGGIVDEPRRTVGLVIGAARRKELIDAASALEERATVIERRTPDASEIAALRLRAAQLALDANEPSRATALLQKVEQALPQLGVVPDLLAAARRRAGERVTAKPRAAEAPSAAGSADAFARVVRDADLALAQGEAPAALALYQRALELRPHDPLASVPMIRVATQLRDAAPITSLALAQLRRAEEAGDGPAKAIAYELLASIDADLRQDPGSAQLSLESAAQADPSRVDLMHRLERQYAAGDQLAELLRLRASEIEALPPPLDRDRVALLLDLAGLSARDGRPEVELADLYRKVLGVEPRTRLALLHLETIVRRSGFSAELAELEEKVAAYFEGDARTQAAFFTRAGETLAEIGRIDEAVQRFGKADAVFPGHVPALEGWRQAALKGQLWIDVAEAATRQAASAVEARAAALHHFAGVALMDKALVGDQAMASFRRALEAEPGHGDAFLRLRILLEEDANHDDLATLLARRLDVEVEPRARIELHRAIAELHRNFLSDRETAKHHFRAILDADANDLRAHAAIADIAWEQGNWQEAADALMARARLERAPDVLKTLCFRLGLIYADRLVDVPMALKAFQRALSYQPDDENTLVRLADLATQTGEWKLALSACERLVKNETDPDRRVAHLHRVARIFKVGFNDPKRAERALNLALDGAPTNDIALTELVQFYRETSDLTSVRVHMNRVAGAMRARATVDPQDGVAYRVIARAMSARAAANVPGSQPIARAAAELAELFGAAGEPEQKLLQTSRQADLSQLTKPEADEVMFARGVPVELRHIFGLLGDRIAKHVGVDLRPYGVTRGDRLRGRDNPVAAVAQSVATGLGFGEIDVYISSRQPWVMIAEPTSPVSLVLGSSIAGAGGDTIRFAAGAALKLAQASLAIPARLGTDELGVLVLALVRLFQPDFPLIDVDADAVAAQAQKLRRLIPTSLMNELKPFALGIDAQRFSHVELSRDLKIAGLRAGLVASGSLLAGLRILASQAGVELSAFLTDPVAQGLVAFALSEDHAVVAR